MRYGALRSPTTIVTAIYCFVGLVVFLTALEGGNAFQPIVSPSEPGQPKCVGIRTNKPCKNNQRLVCTTSARTRNRNVVAFESPLPGKEGDSLPKIVDATELDQKQLEEIISEPPIEFEWRVLQQMLGINIFTVILAALIVFFLSMNAILGPGWLGSTLGIPGTGNIEEVSPTLPGSLDLNRPEYRL
mmetsp:Transcript_22608/g.53366  ORF Transcript_22608/g.53366 Transcript_22608/m.53366 type:complete len:187 (-) Transcript_22608:227-787(-)